MSSIAEISAQRHEEDLRFLAGFETSRLCDLGFLDAPLRLLADPATVCGLSPALDPGHESVGRKLASVLVPGAVILPLALGGHVDHLLARDETLELISGRPEYSLAFYEDLPYAMRFDPVENEINAILDSLSVSAHPRSITGDPEKKLRHASCYGSQVTDEECRAISQYGNGSERLWIPQGFEIACRESGIKLPIK